MDMQINICNEKEKKIPEREYFVDNMRFILIFLAVLGHLLTIAEPFAGSKFLYKVIYSFHMPAFIFVFGYYAKFNIKRIVFHWLVPYVCFQTFLFTFYRLVLGLDTKLQYINPFWSLWFLLTCMVFQLVLPLINTNDKKKQLFILLGSICAALLIGYVDFIGKVLSLSRIFVYFPWFLMGVYLHMNGGFSSIFSTKKTTMKWFVCSLVGCVLSVLFMYNFNIKDRMLYGSHPYSVSGQTIWVRGIVMIITFSWIVLLCSSTKLFASKRIPLITYIGQCTLAIYLLHGYILKSVAHFCPVLVSKPLYVFILAVVLIFALGNNALKKFVYYIGFSWLENVVPIINKPKNIRGKCYESIRQ